MTESFARLVRMEIMDFTGYFEAKKRWDDEEIRVNTNVIYHIIKRLIDICFSVVGLILGLPFVLVFGVLIYLESPGSIIFRQERVGHSGKLFTVYKLRSMRLDAEKNGQKWADKNDSRVLKVGKFIRKVRIDEIPQFVNILLGDMSIVGPRPEIPKFTYEFNEQYPGFVNRLLVKPGLTGLAQVTGGYDMNPDEKLEKDLEYINNQSLLLDLKIMLQTFRVIVTGDGAR